jgi:hypothetical protein
LLSGNIKNCVSEKVTVKRFGHKLDKESGTFWKLNDELLDIHRQIPLLE